MTVDEVPVCFDCCGSQLLGMVHRPAQALPRGLVILVAGGPQYRSGVGRMQVSLARALATAGVAVMRFDYRGMGDSEGEFRGFEWLADDLAAAIATFKAQVPDLQEVAVFGGCDAASAAMIHGPNCPETSGMIIGNPWVHSEATHDAVEVKHFGRRFGQWDFWRKVITLRYNPWPALLVLARRTLGLLQARQASPAAVGKRAPFQTRMREGMGRFQGDVLLLMSGRSLLSKEFDELVAMQPAWQHALAAPRSLQRVDLADADQTFSGMATRRTLEATVVAWMTGVHSDNRHLSAARWSPAPDLAED